MAKNPPNSSGCGRRTPSCGAPTTSSSPRPVSSRPNQTAHTPKVIEGSGVAGGIHNPGMPHRPSEAAPAKPVATRARHRVAAA
jgi:hypothetical protein